ncbi:MAG: Holliday junction resolvase RuvX [Saprospiraceae bacterium]|nr:Holliday junction resolvase RuvX [Saprospiraceae bacterium]
MGRILCVDYGLKRCGLAATDPFQLIVNGLQTVETSELIPFLKNYCTSEKVDKIVIGLPTHKDGNFTSIKPDIDRFASVFTVLFPGIAVDYADEQFSSVQAKEAIFQSGAKKKTRQDKALVDKISAVIILQRYLKHF